MAQRQVNLNRNVPVSELQVGMYISDVGNDWIPAKRKKRKGYIRSQATIDKIKSLGVLRVCIEFLNEEQEQAAEAAPASPPVLKTTSDQQKIVKITDKIVMNDSKHAHKHGQFVEETLDQDTSSANNKKESAAIASLEAGPEQAAQTATGQGLLAEVKESKSAEADAEPTSVKGGLLDDVKSQQTKGSSNAGAAKGGLLDALKKESDAQSQTTGKGGLLDEIKANKPPETPDKGRPALREGIAQRAKKYIPGAVVIPFDQEFDRAKALHAEAKARVEEAMQLAKIGKPFDIDGIEEMSNGLIDSIVSNRNTLCMMTVLKSQENYLYEHSVNCGVLMGIFARHMKLSMDVIHDLVTGAILHDIGMIEVSPEIINKPDKLTPPEEKEMQRHIVLGRKILEKNRGVPAIAFEVCKQHHERLDGQGYMQKMHSHQVNQYGRVGAIVDIYDALTSQRSYRKAFSPAAAMKKLLEMSGGQLDAKLVYQFIQCINIYPVGSLVQLDDSRVGVVHELNVFKKDKPKVRVFYSGKDKHYFESKTVDLADPNIRIKIKKTVDIEDFDIELENVI